MAGGGGWRPTQGPTALITPGNAETCGRISGPARAKGKQEEARGWSGLPWKDRADSAEYADVAFEFL